MRRTICSAVNSIVVYGAPIWNQVLSYAQNRDMLLQVQRRLALRICSTSRTVSTEAIQVIPGVVPLDLLVN